MAVAQYRVSGRGQIALPVELRHRWGIADGGIVEVADLGSAVVVTPAGRYGLRSMLSEALEDAGSYQSLVRRVVANEPDLA